LPAWRHLVHEALLLLAVLTACAVPSARADVTLSGAVWAGGYPNGIDQLTILDADGGSGSGSTGGGLGRAWINVTRAELGVTQRIVCSGRAGHPDPGNGHTSGYSSEASGQTFRGIVIAVSTPSLFRISSCASATTWSGDREPIQPFRLTAITGAFTGDGITGSMQPGTYLLEFYVGGFAPGAMPDIPDAVKAGYGELAELGVKGAGGAWILDLSPTGTSAEECDGSGIVEMCPSWDSDGDRFLDACEQRWGDIVLDGVVDGADLGALLVTWGTSTSESDLNGDAIVDGADLGILLGHWGQTPWAEPGLVEVSPSVGPAAGGTLITLTGTNLTGATGVTVGGVAASTVQVINATTVTAVTPAGSLGAKPVGVTTAFGTATLASAYSYRPAPTLASVSPSTGPAFGSTLITLTGTNLTDTNLWDWAVVTVGGVACTSVQRVSPTTVTAVTPAGTVGAREVAVTTPFGTASLAGAFTYTPVVPYWATLIEAEPDPAVVWDETLRAAIRATGWAWRVRDTATQIEMLLIPPGTFDMGCSASVQYGCNGHESPVHSVTLTFPFYLGRYEVTQAQWQARMGSNPSLFQNASAQVPAAQVPNRPVERVSWNMVASFMAQTGMRLPMEAEWEYAYRAGTSTAFHGFTGYPNGTNDGTLAGSIGWRASNSINQTRPVGGKAGNGFGLHDMAGNVFEWVSDWYSSSYYASSPATNPFGPAGGASRVFRGGSYVYDSYELRASYRNGEAPGSASNGLGFRAARMGF
jgi:formylglycine-generating enzyme required for sulfatase activity